MSKVLKLTVGKIQINCVIKRSYRTKLHFNDSTDHKPTHVETAEKTVFPLAFVKTRFVN